MRDTITVTKKRLQNYFRIYEQIYDNSFISQRLITKNTGISKSSVSKYLEEMYQYSIMQGPLIFVKPAVNYRRYVYFCQFNNPGATYENLKRCPHVVFRYWNCGKWNITILCDTEMNLSLFKDFQYCIHEGAKSVTYLSKVTSLTWEESMRKIQSVLSPPKEKTTLYKEILSNPWGKKEWLLYNEFKYNTRMKARPVLRKYKIRYESYETWFSHLLQYANIHPAFFPAGSKKYFYSDFLFQSDYHTQLTNILGLLPSTSIFFSVNDYLFARVSVITRKEETDLFSLISQLEEENFFTDFHYTRALFS